MCVNAAAARRPGRGAEQEKKRKKYLLPLPLFLVVPVAAAQGLTRAKERVVWGREGRSLTEKGMAGDLARFREFACAIADGEPWFGRNGAGELSSRKRKYK